MSGRTATLSEVGLDAEKVERLLSRVRHDVEEGLMPAAQVALARNGKVAVSESFGSTKNDSLTCLFSATKGIVYAAAWLLIQEGQLSEDEFVADIIPEFSHQGKERVTVQQVFTHTSGFPSAPFAPLQWNSKEETLKRFSQWRLNWLPGSRYEYHPTSSMWVIAEIIERRGGLAYAEFIRKRVLDPLSLDSVFVGLPENENCRVLPVEYYGLAMTGEDYAKLGLPVPPETEINEEILLAYNRPDVRAVGVPGAGGFGNAVDLALLYQALLHGGLDEVEVWSENTLASAREIRTGNLVDAASGQEANRGLGTILCGDKGKAFRGFGEANSAQSFGHPGAGGQIAWADPATGISLVYLTPGHDRNLMNQMQRCVSISHLAAQCAL
ncbi:MAG: CubicO group peptidase (beta-lactamase class C family) [Porticoccaceae bacterium]|jgi:CubicO group peptidase (beta-lactamase class C family)